MSACERCCGKGYIGLKRHETVFGPPTDRPCPDCSGIASSQAESWFPRWKTVIMFRRCDTELLYDDLVRLTGCYVSPNARRWLQSLSLTPYMNSINAVRVTSAELGFNTRFVTTEMIYDRARELGLELCDGDLAAELRLDYDDQPTGETLLIAMTPMVLLATDSFVLALRNHSGELQLSSDTCSMSSVWTLDTEWVFVKPGNK